MRAAPGGRTDFRAARRRYASSRLLGGSGTRAGSELKFISCTPACTMPAPVTRNRWSTIVSTSGCSRSSASSTPTQSQSQMPMASRSCSARFSPIGLLWTSVSSGYRMSTMRRGKRRAHSRATASVFGSSG